MTKLFEVACITAEEHYYLFKFTLERQDLVATVGAAMQMVNDPELDFGPKEFQFLLNAIKGFVFGGDMPSITVY